jgi:hypothetical protein
LDWKAGGSNASLGRSRTPQASPTPGRYNGLVIRLLLAVAAVCFAGPREAAVSGFSKANLPVTMTLRTDRRADLAARRGRDDPRLAEIAEAFAGVRAVRSVEVADGDLRGPATRSIITIREDGPDGLVVEGRAAGDPRTQAGRANVRMNVERLTQRFRDMVLARAEARAFDNHAADLNQYGDKLTPTADGRGADIASQRQDELDLAALAEARARAAGGEKVVALDLGGGFGAHSIRLAEAGASVTMIDVADMASSAFARSAAKERLAFLKKDFRAITPADLPDGLQILYSQRAIHYVRYAEALALLKLAAAKMAPGGAVFLSAAGHGTEYGLTYPDRDKPVEERFALVTPDMRAKHAIAHEIATYREEDAAKLLAEAGFVDVKVTRSSFGNIKATARKPAAAAVLRPIPVFDRAALPRKISAEIARQRAVILAGIADRSIERFVPLEKTKTLVAAVLTRLLDRSGLAALAEGPAGVLPRVQDSAWGGLDASMSAGVLSMGPEMIAVMSSVDEIAAVMAHELAHYILGHNENLLRGRSWLSKLLPRRKADILDAPAAPSRKEIEARLKHEFEADALSLRLLVNAGYDPSAAISALLAIQRERDTEPRYEFERGLFDPLHPAPEARVETLRRVMAREGMTATARNSEGLAEVYRELASRHRPSYPDSPASELYQHYKRPKTFAP